MIEQLKSELQTFRKKTISIDELRQLKSTAYLSYEQFAEIIQQLEDEKMLEMVKSHGRSPRPPHLAHTYRIQKATLKAQYFIDLQNLRLELHPLIQLDAYFKSDETLLQKELPYLRKINLYIKSYGLPTYEVPAPERSVELVGDEKWIEYAGGEECLKRIGLWENMSIIPVSDPLMFAVNVGNLHKTKHFHLIVENKTTYQALLPTLQSSQLTTLIYGSGWKISKSLENFHLQFPIKGTHRFYYFGDVDRTGISILYKMNQLYDIVPATIFYEACLQVEPSFGKETQPLLKDALPYFLSHFNHTQQQKIETMLETDHYLPQEVLKTKQLQQLLGVWSDAID